MTKTTFKIGELIENRYRVLSVIGSGGMGILYRISDEAHHDGAHHDGAEGDKVVALKMVRLKHSEAETPERVKHFQREFQLLTQLHHPNLVSVYDYGITTEEELYFTMEWVEGQDLEPSLHPLEPGATVPVMVQVCRALAYLHARGVIHGDLKPGNVLMMADAGDADDAGHARDRRHRVKLVDFGLAHEVRSPEDRARYYTPGYTAPETREQHPVDHRTDLYSLGAMWYALLVGEPPMFMPGVGKERLIRFALDEALESQDQIPKAMGAVVARLMAMSPDDRYGSANEVIAAVNEITEGEYALETRETASSYALRTHFVNREAEMEMLQALWEQAQSDEGKLVLISGESGVGKTRLMTELEVQAEMKGAHVVWGQCVESGGSAYQPWREVMRVLARYVEGVDEATMQRLGPVLATLLPELWERDYMQALEPPADLDPQAAQRRLNDAIVQILHTAAGLRPTVLVIENVHWADEATLEMLRFLARIPGHIGLLMCVTYRDEEVEADHLLEKLEGAVSRSGGGHYGEQVQRIRVHRLSPEVTTDLVCSMLGLEQLPALLAERVQQTTEGNAFFVQELIRSLATEGEVLRRTVRGWQVDRTALREAQLPESIRQVVWRRMDQLSPEGRQVLNWAAGTGMVFWERGVAKVGQVAWQRVRVALREGIEQELVVVRDEASFAGEREYLFLNPTVWEVCYESIPREERRGNHARIAAWLMARSDEEANEHLGLIAEHLEKAGQVEQAVTYLRQAGEQAAAQFANAEAVGYFSRALELTPEDDREVQYALLLDRERVYHLQGTREAQAQDLTTLEELAEALADAQRRAEAALRRANYAQATADYTATIAAAQTAIRLAQTAQDASQEATGHLRWGRALMRQGKYKAARLQMEQALALAQTAQLRQVQADGLRYLGLVSRYQNDYAGAKTYYGQALDLFRDAQHGDRQGEGWAISNLGDVSKDRGDYAEAWVYFEQALHIFREIGDRRGEVRARNNLGDVSRHQGNYAGARTYFEQALRVAHEIGDREGEFTELLNLGLVLHHLDDNETAQGHNQQALLIAQETGNRRWQGYALTNLGHALAGLERHAQAADAFQQAMDIRRELGQPHMAMESLAGMAHVSLTQGDLLQAQAQVDEIVSYLDVKGNTLDGTEEPLRIYLTCYHILRANQNPRAQAILDTAHHLLQERAAKISDEELRRLFLENVAAHREIIKVWESG